MVAGHEHDRRPGERPPELLEHRPGDLERVGERALAQLDHVAEQHDPVGAAERLDERLARLAVTRDVRPAEAPRCRSETTTVRIGGMVSGR